jgi:hypothetical protein
MIGMIVLLGLLPASPAQAAAAGSFFQLGTMNVGYGMAHTCVGENYSGSFTVDPERCLGPFSSSPQIAYFSYGGTLVGSAVNTTANTTAGGAAEVGTFWVAATGTIRGSCDFWSAYMSGRIHPDINLGTQADRERSFSAQVVYYGGKGVITGTTSLGETLVGEFNAVPTTGSCTNYYAKSFTTWGVIALAAP